jgi:hypothetical protein
MATAVNVTLAAARARARSFSPRVAILHALLHATAAAGLAGVGAIAAFLVLGWSWLWVVALAVLAASGITLLWMAGTLGFLLQAGATSEQRRSRGWLLAVALVGLAGAIAPEVPWWSALMTAASGLGLAPVLMALGRRIEATRLTSWQLPPALLPPLQALPQWLPGRLDLLLERAFRDWMHLRDLLALTADSGIRSYVDKSALALDAERTVLYLLHRAPLVAKLLQLAEERREEHATQAAERAFRRIDAIGATLHDAVAAASQFAASEQRDEGLLLRARVETLNELAEGLEVDPFEIVEDPARVAARREGPSG